MYWNNGILTSLQDANVSIENVTLQYECQRVSSWWQWLTRIVWFDTGGLFQRFQLT